MGCSASCMQNITSRVNMSRSSSQVSQFAQEVVHFSSQYGRDGSMAYVVPNLAGPPSVFPNYGDFTQACVFRTYGPWWRKCPSAEKPIGKSCGFNGTDFIDLYYNEKVIPTSVQIYETYHPGSVIQICAAEIERKDQQENVTWYELWSGVANTRHFQPQMFSPSLKKINVRINLIRLVVDHRQCDYYTELDSVELVGFTTVDDEGTDIDEVYIKRLEQLSIDEKKSFDSDIPLKVLPLTDNGHFDLLPGELIQHIFQYLGLDDICQAATTCSLFRRHCYDPLLNMELNLQPYWRVISGSVLQGLAGRCTQLQKLDMSWCGGWDKIQTDKDFCCFLEECGRDLKVLRLKACRFVTGSTIKAISKTCLKLEELNLASCQNIKPNNYGVLHSLQKLLVLNLYRSSISEAEICKILCNTPNMKHLNLGGINTIHDNDNVLQEIGKSCPLLESLDMWRARPLSHTGVSSLASGCPNLLELDLGWCSELRANNSWVGNLCSHCPKLRKLFLTSIRNVGDNDMNAIASKLHDLEQLDLLGAVGVGPQGMARVLDQCPKLYFLDVSFCRQLTLDVVSQFIERYPHISIKKSFTP